MGEDTCIYVNKSQVKELYFTALSLEKNFGHRWNWFKDKFHLESYPYGKFYFTAEDILRHIAGKKVKEEQVMIINSLLGKDCLIMGDYSDFPKDKNKDEYVDLTSILYGLWNDKFNKINKDEDKNAPRN